jgi:NADH dehydrogenase
MDLVVGATGNLGGMIARRLLQAGKDVRILVRHNSPSEELAKQGRATSAASLVEAGAQPVYGDLKDRASLDPACDGIETVISTANSAQRGGEDNEQTVDLLGNRSLIDAARAAGVRQFIFTSALPADATSPLPFLQAKGLSETHLRESGIPYTILAPNAFIEVWVGLVIGMPLQAGRPVTLVGEGRRLHTFISQSDVAALAVAALGHPAAMNRRLVLGGPEALSWRDVVATFERVLGRDVPVRFVGPEGPVPGESEHVFGLLASMETYDSAFDTSELARTFGVELTTLESAVRAMLGGPRGQAGGL